MVVGGRVGLSVPPIIPWDLHGLNLPSMQNEGALSFLMSLQSCRVIEKAGKDRS